MDVFLNIGKDSVMIGRNTAECHFIIENIFYDTVKVLISVE
jgi:hypothetical protein